MKKSFVLGLVTGLTMAGVSLVIANSQIQAILNDQIKVTLDGQVQKFIDETSNEVQYPITYNDRTYLPLRNVAQLAGLNVDYDSTTNTAVLQRPHYFSRFAEDGGNRETFFFKDYLVILASAPWGQVEAELILIDSNGKENIFNIYYDEENNKFLYKVENDKLIITEYKYDGQDDSHYGMAKYHRRDYEIAIQDGKIVERTIEENFDDVKHDASV